MKTRTLKLWWALIAVCTIACLASVLNACMIPTEDQDAGVNVAGSAAVQPVTVKNYKVVNSNFGADIAAMIETNLIRLWVMQFTDPSHYQPGEWSCSGGVSTGRYTCFSNISTASHFIDMCKPDPVQPNATRCRLEGGSGWATMVRCTNALCGTTTGWYAQFNNNGIAANAQGQFPSSHPILTVRNSSAFALTSVPSYTDDQGRVYLYWDNGDGSGVWVLQPTQAFLLNRTCKAGQCLPPKKSSGCPRNVPGCPSGVVGLP